VPSADVTPGRDRAARRPVVCGRPGAV